MQGKENNSALSNMCYNFEGIKALAGQGALYIRLKKGLDYLVDSEDDDGELKVQFDLRALCRAQDFFHINFLLQTVICHHPGVLLARSIFIIHLSI